MWCSELSWPLDIAPNAHNIGLYAIQTSTPRNPEVVLPPLKTPATDYTKCFQASSSDEHPQAWHHQRTEANNTEQFEAQPNQFTPQPHAWPVGSDDTLRQCDVDRGEDDKAQYLYVGHEDHEHLDNAEERDVHREVIYDGEYYNMDQAHPVRNKCTGSMEQEHQGHMFTCAQHQPSEYGQVFSKHHWNQQMYALEPQDVTDAVQSQTADSRNYFSDNVQMHFPCSDEHRAVNTTDEMQWSTAATFAHVVSNAAQPEYVSFGTSAAFENNVTSSCPRMHASVAPSREVSSRSLTKITDMGDGDLAGYRVQYKHPARDQFHTVSAAGDACQKVTAEQASTQIAPAKTVPERLQQAFLQSGE